MDRRQWTSDPRVAGATQLHETYNTNNILHPVRDDGAPQATELFGVVFLSMKQLALAVVLLLASQIGWGRTVAVLPANPASDDLVFVENASYFATLSETHTVSGNVVTVHFVEATWDWLPNPPMPAGLAEIGYLAPGAYTVNVQVDFGSETTSYSFPLTVTASPTFPTLNYQGLWWVPDGAESGWGLSLAHQGDAIFGVWFTYDLAGRGRWLAMTALRTGTGSYQGDLYQTNGPALTVDHFDRSLVVNTKVGTGTLTFSDRDHGSFSYEVWPPGRMSFQPIARTVSIAREVFGPSPSCRSVALPALSLATNYQDLWWEAPGSSASGWGINLSHQGDTIFGTWYTYDLDGAPLWLVVTANKMGDDSYQGVLYRTKGPPFSDTSFDPHSVIATPVGSAKLAFADGNHGTIAYSVQLDGMPSALSRSKALTRFVFTSASGTACR